MRIERLSAGQARAEVPGLARILLECVRDGASVGFLSSITVERAGEFWNEVAEQVERGARILLAARDPETGELAGTVQVAVRQPDNQPHRADIAKMLVRPRFRRRGLGAALMRRAEEEALAAGRWLLVLDTVSGSDAARLYRTLGWSPAGEVPDYALYPDGRLCSTTVYYKRLAEPEK
jgi:GNAT superfamily N-acetyltransferase